MKAKGRLTPPRRYRNAQGKSLRCIENFFCDDKFFAEKFETSRFCREGCS